MGGKVLRVVGLSKEFLLRRKRPVRALESVSFELNEGELLSIIGPSGCGKTTTLNIIARLVPPTAGEVIYGGAPDRPFRIAYIFQEPRLLSWRDVVSNVRFGLEADLIPPERADLEGKVAELIKLVGLEGFEDKYPHQISGGMQQRVALARGLAIEPTVLLMDEPFGSLDALTRSYLQEELLGIVSRARVSGLLITHDIDEAILMGDRVLVMSARPGRIKETVEVPFPRPRELSRLVSQVEYLKLKAHLLELLRPEVARVFDAQRLRA